MKQEMHIDYPNLPILPINACLSVFIKSGFGPSFVSKATGISRPVVSAWFNGRVLNHNKSVQNAVSALAYRSLRALRHKKLPFKTKRSASFDEWMDLLRDGPRYDRPLAQYRAEELMPDDWQAKTNVRTPNGPAELL